MKLEKAVETALYTENTETQRAQSKKLAWCAERIVLST